MKLSEFLMGVAAAAGTLLLIFLITLQHPSI